MRQGLPWPVVALDRIAGPESIMTIAPNFEHFLEALGVADDSGQLGSNGLP